MSHNYIAQGTMINERYQILQSIGEGSTAVVYLVWDKRLAKQWALKAVCKEKAELNQTIVSQEAKILLELEHPCLPRVIDVFEWDCFEMIVRDYIDGENLDSYVQNHGPFDLPRLKTIAFELAKVLEYLHERPVPLIYRDLKPANIIVQPEGRIALIDFGIARQYNPLHYADTVPLGTKGYCAPEQYGHGQSGPWTDVYGFGGILYYLLCGEHYFLMPLQELWDAFASEDMIKARQVIEKCMATQIDERFVSVKEAVSALYNPNQYEVSIPKIVMKGKDNTVHPSKVVYGFIGTHRGVGTTHAAWSLAVALSKSKYRVAIVLQHQHHTYHLWRQYIEGERYHDMTFEKQISGVDFFKMEGVTVFPRQSPKDFLLLLDKPYDVVIADFGSEASSLSDFLRCHKKWVVCSATPWTYPQTNWALNALRAFDDLKYLVNLSESNKLNEMAEWLGIRRYRLSNLPYCDASKVDETHLSYFEIQDMTKSKKRRMLFWQNA